MAGGKGSDPESKWTGVGGQLLTLLGLSGFALSQPLLAVAGENPTLFTFASVEGRHLVLFALLVALVPPLALWGVVVVARALNQRVGTAVFLVWCGLLAGAAAAQWAWTLGLDSRVGRGLVAGAVAVAFPWLSTRFSALAMWVRFTAILPALSVLLLFIASPAGGLLQGRREAVVRAGSDHPSVVLVMLDEFPTESILTSDRQIDAQRFPNLSALAADATWYRDYTSMTEFTPRSIPSLLSGKVPSQAAPLWTSVPDNLFSLLAPTHNFVVSESLTRLCGFSTCGIESDQASLGIGWILGQMNDVWQQRVGLKPHTGPNFDQFQSAALPLGDAAADTAAVDLVEEGEMTSSVIGRPKQASSFIEALDRGWREPTLGYIHLMLPHQPWRLSPSGEPLENVSPVDYQFATTVTDEWDLAMLQQAHLFQAQYADAMVGQILDSLRANGTYDDSVVVVTADHGVGFHRSVNDIRNASEANLDEIAYVPLLIKAPGQQTGRVDDSNLMGVDLLPTIADLAGVNIPWKTDGVPAGDPAIDARGTDKQFFDFDNLGLVLDRIIDFDQKKNRPSADNRLVGSVAAGDNPLLGLLGPIGGEKYLGRRVTGYRDNQAGTVKLDAGRTAVRLVGGRLNVQITDGPESGTVLLVVDGVVESMSPIQIGGRLSFFVLPEVAARGEQVDFVLVEGDDLAELSVAG